MDSAEEVPDPSLLAFATSDIETDPPLIVASSQCPFYTKDRVLLNVECFGPIYNGTNVNNNASDVDDDGSSHNGNNNTTDEWPILLYVHGICESAETQGVQTLAQYCAKHCWRLIVLELAGHGLSDNISGMCRATCPNFDQLVQHVVEFTLHIEKKFSQSKGMVLSGGSLGGALVVYAVQDIISERSRVTERTNNSSNIPNFYGIALLAPALGIKHPCHPSFSSCISTACSFFHTTITRDFNTSRTFRILCIPSIIYTKLLRTVAIINIINVVRSYLSSCSR